MRAANPCDAPSTFTSFGAGIDVAGWGEIANRARAIRSAYLAAQFRKVAATLLANRRGG